ncbi:hypothetical protein JTE90_003802 [Oedothorax gibbosus]|uniref:Ribosomal RNA-processing protein 7 C-terminal domain-containing protein n=1 Tax=Oedothorax gibbosus TaxID=931172 RepID=A0AAV6V9K3_9ARAC|nr:hypothetical protein JTE90_003802 [Oedothorax gibbosus]
MKEKIGDFYLFPYNLGDSSVVRYFFVKQHEGTDDIKPSDRTLYITNVPQYLNKICLKHLFLDYGAIERVFIHSKPTSGGEIDPKSSKFLPQVSQPGSKFAYVVYYKPVSLKRVVKTEGPKNVPLEKFKKDIGKSKWTREYNTSFVNGKEMEEEVKKYMEKYDKKAEEEKKQEKMQEEPDDEGWVTVSKFSKKPKIPRIESVNKRLLAKQAAAQTKLTLMKFYKNQLRDAKMEQILEMRKRFEKDKAQIAMMKNNRKFKPF